MWKVFSALSGILKPNRILKPYFLNRNLQPYFATAYYGVLSYAPLYEPLSTMHLGAKIIPRWEKSLVVRKVDLTIYFQVTDWPVVSDLPLLLVDAEAEILSGRISDHFSKKSTTEFH